MSRVPTKLSKLAFARSGKAPLSRGATGWAGSPRTSRVVQVVIADIVIVRVDRNRNRWSRRSVRSCGPCCTGSCDRNGGSANCEDTSRRSESVSRRIGSGCCHCRRDSASADGSISEAQLVYHKDHKQYSDILKHLGGLKPGESKSFAPWPDE
jgi:hypothetical protein